MKKRVLSLALLLGAGMQFAFGQGLVVKGTVVDEAGNPVIGASVETIDQKMSTFTDAEGNFEMEIPEGAEPQLKISYLNMEHNVAAAGDLSRIILKKTSTSLEGVVVTGYRTITKEKYVGAADNISSEHIEKMPVADITRALEGAAPGLQFAGDGSPGGGANIRIRGFGSVTGSSAPLFVVDGTPYEGDISAINPLDIENVTVLKDATATSLYGSRGANGVIVITTKRGRGRDNAPAINIDIRSGFVQRGLPNYDIMTSEAEYYETAWRAYVHNLQYNVGFDDFNEAARIASGLEGLDEGLINRLGGYNSYNVPDDQVVGVDGKINPGASLKYHDNWDDEITRTGMRNEINLNVGNSDGKNDYYFSLGYLDEQGFIKYSDYERFSGRLNVNSQVKDYLKVGLNLSGTLTSGNYFESTGASSGNPMYISKDFAPIFPVYYYDQNGNREQDPITGNDKFDWGATSSSSELVANSSIGERPGLQNSNILGSMSMNTEQYKTLSVLAVPYIEVTFLKNFTFNTMLSYNYYDINNINHNNVFYGQFALNGGSNYRRAVTQNIYTFRQMLTYNKDFNEGKSNLNVFAAHENYDLTARTLSANATGIPIPGNSNLSGANQTTASSQDDFFRMESYLIGASYIHNNELFFDASARWDGTSRFSPTARWNTVPFWALGVGYDLKSADFMSEVDAIKSLKVKASYGTQGNQNIGGYYVWQSLYNTNFPNGNSLGGIMTEMGNDALTWEAQGQFNAGVEFNAFNEKLYGEVNFFNRTQSDLLFMVPTAPSMGIQEMPRNTATMFNRGVEVTLGSHIINSLGNPDRFDWSVNLNLTHFKNEITEMPGGLDSFLSGQFQYKKGHSVYDFYIVEHAGVNPESGAEMYWNIDDEGNRVQDSVWANVASSGRTYIGSAIPDLFGTFVSNMNYKGFNLQFTLAYGLGGDYYDGVYASLMGPGSWGRNWHRDILNSWTTENTGASLPRTEINNINIGNASTRFLTDASYLNIRNITFGYTLPASWTDKIKLNNVRIYALLDNVHLFSARQGMNPQSSFSGQSDYTYTPARTIMFGVKFGL